MNVLSCFDGISCGQLALKKNNTILDKYYASEIEKNAISITQHNFSDTIQLGDITNWKKWNIDFSKIDLLIGGSPCFTETTKIITENGYKNINEIIVGDKVLTDKNRFRKVVKTGGKLANIYCIKNKGCPDVYVTGNHPFLVKEDIESPVIWKRIDEVKPTDYFTMLSYNALASNKNIKKIPKEYKTWSYNIKQYSVYFSDNNFIYFRPNSIDNEYKEEMVYNIEVEEDHTYIANNTIVHNCQGFSMRGKMLNFEDPRSKLFFEYCEILNYIKNLNPNVKFLLENVKMKKEFISVFNEKLGVNPIEINSNLLSAQNRKRLYWTNISGVTVPQDLNIVLKDVVDLSLPSEISFEEMYKKTSGEKWYYVGKKLKEFQAKYSYMPIFFNPYNLKDLKDKSVTLTAHCGQLTCTAAIIIVNKDGVRNITTNELEKLQTLPTEYTSVNNTIPKTARYAAIGNGWTVDVISHILSFME